MSAALNRRSIGLLHWRDPAVIGVALIALAAGFGQFGAVAALGDVAKSFGRLSNGATLADQAGLSGTTLGIGLAVLRLASLVALPLTGLADRVGRRRTMLASCGLGLAITVGAAASLSYWWFVAIFALGRPLLSTASAIGQVVVAEYTSAKDRASAVALVTAGYGIGSGATALIHGLGSSALGFRGLFLLAVVPLAGLPIVARHVVETDRFVLAHREDDQPLPVLGAIGGRYRRRLGLIGAIAFAVALTSGPSTGFVYLYAENVRRLPGGVVAAMVLLGGLAGFGGLVSGRWLADHVGRRSTGMVAMLAMSLAGMVVYSGSSVALVIGYVTGIFSASNLAPAAGAFVNELFPTSVRASVAGWLIVASVLGAVVGLLVFGTIADAGARFSLGAVVTFSLSIPVALVFLALPETVGRELEGETT